MSTVFTYEYDTTYNPAMPMVEISVGRAMHATTLTLTALVDSGADATIVPIAHLREIGARRSRKMWLRGTAGGKVLVDLYRISLRLGPYSQPHLEVVGGVQDNEIIVGRDVLNHLAINLNGPAHSVEIVGDSRPIE